VLAPSSSLPPSITTLPDVPATCTHDIMAEKIAQYSSIIVASFNLFTKILYVKGGKKE
jgi:hypothetical protein